jgi:hypothetical protein
VRDDPVDAWVLLQLGMRPFDRDLLPPRARCVDRLAAAVRRRAEGLEDAEDRVAVLEGALQTLDDHDAGAVREQHAVGVLVERP